MDAVRKFFSSFNPERSQVQHDQDDEWVEIKRRKKEAYDLNTRIIALTKTKEVQHIYRRLIEQDESQ